MFVHDEGHGKGWALEIETFLFPEMAMRKRVPFGTSEISRAHPLQYPE
jgi:hypothetical protein